MSMKYLNSLEHEAMVKAEREINIPKLQKLRDMLDSGECIMNRETIVKNPLWEHGYVQCIGVECRIKTTSTKHECPLDSTPNGCWWIYAHEWRLNNDRKRHGISILRKEGDI